MADRANLEQRMTAALARLNAGFDRLMAADTRPSAEQADHIAHLQAQLDAERAARSLEPNELSALTAKDHAAQIDHLQRRLDETDLENQRLHTAISLLRQDLRLMEEQAEAHLDKANRATATLQAEMDALVEARAAETAEIAKILAALAPLFDAEEAQPDA